MGGRCKKQVKEETEPKNAHGIQFNLNVNSEDADAVREALVSAGHVKIADKLEIKRELSIMHEVWGSEGENINMVEWSRKRINYELELNDLRVELEIINKLIKEYFEDEE